MFIGIVGPFLFNLVITTLLERFEKNLEKTYGDQTLIASYNRKFFFTFVIKYDIFLSNLRVRIQHCLSYKIFLGRKKYKVQ